MTVTGDSDLQGRGPLVRSIVIFVRIFIVIVVKLIVKLITITVHATAVINIVVVVIGSRTCSETPTYLNSSYSRTPPQRSSVTRVAVVQWRI